MPPELRVREQATGIPPFDISRFIGHAKPTTTLGIYAHLFADDHSDAMAALGAMGSLAASSNVVHLWRRSRSSS